MDELVDVTSVQYHNDIYHRYQILREQHPVYFDSLRNIWMITRYEDVRALLRDTNTAHNADTGHSYLPALTTMDGVEHKNLRAEIMPFFSQTAMQTARVRVDEMLSELFDQLPQSGPIDILNAVVKRLPQRFVTEFLGFPMHLAEQWYALGDQLVGVDPESAEQAAPQVALECLDTLQELFREAIRWKREHQHNDFFSWLASADTEARIGEQGVITLGNNIGLAALDTTINLLGNGTGLLAQHPDQRQLLIEQPELIPKAVEEMLRIEAPTQALPRRISSDLQLHGETIPAGSEISLVFAAANHDPAKYAEPASFDVQRSNHDHLALGFGVHKCVGQHLARVEANGYFAELLRRYPDYELIEHRWLLSHWARGYAALSISS